jgi:hydroxymethylcytosylglucuronate/cytosylglucuronate synthase
MRLLVNATNFGLGSAGKLASVLSELSGATAVVYGSELGANLFDGSVPIVGRATSGTPLAEVIENFDVDVALVVLDPGVANELTGLGLPVVYLDSLPFMWTQPAEVPTGVTAYLAQLSPLPIACPGPLRAVDNLGWIGAVVPRTEPRDPGHSADVVVNMGGLASWFSQADDLVYPWMVLPPLLESLSEAGFGSVLVTTSTAAIPIVSAAAEGHPGLDVTVRSMPHPEFIAALVRCRLLVTSPGLTTLLESGHLRVPTVVLPPQNLSQCLNIASVTAVGGGDRCVHWPGDLLDLSAVENARQQGEHVAVGLIYRSLERGRTRPDLRRTLRVAMDFALAATPTSPAAALTELIGVDGARQVAECLRSLVRQPAGYPSTEETAR